MNTAAKEKVTQYLAEAHATERALTRVLQSQIAMTPSGGYRDALEKHLRETQDHAGRVSRRIDELGGRSDPLGAAGVLVESVLGQALALAKTPLDLVRGTGGEEKVLKNAKDAAATEALEIATYTALERLAHDVGDERTAELARDIRADEERMLERVLQEIPQLTGKVVGADVRGNPTYAAADTGAGQAVSAAAEKARDAVGEVGQEAKRTARQARRVPGVAQAEGAAKGAMASADDLPIPRYDSLTAEEIVSRLPQLSQIDLAKVAADEGRHDDRTTVTNRVSALLGDEPWPGYDELTVPQVRDALDGADEERARAVVRYERAHKDRAGVIDAAESVAAAA